MIVEAPAISTLDDVLDLFRSASGLDGVLGEDGEAEDMSKMQAPGCDEDAEQDADNEDESSDEEASLAKVLDRIQANGFQ